MTDALDALRDVDFNWVRSLDSVWSEDDITTGAPNEALADSIVARLLKDAHAKTHPDGEVFIGQSGIGKTHLVGLLRRRVWKSGGWFVLLDVLGLTDFWRSAALSYLTSLMQLMPGGRRQFEAVLAGVARNFHVEKEVEAALGDPKVEPRRIIDLLVKRLLIEDPNNALRHQDVFRALSLLRSSDLDTVSLAHSWLQGYDADEAARAALGFQKPPPSPVELVAGMSWIMSLSGPTLVAVDQIDGIVNPSSLMEADAFTNAQPLSSVLTAGLLQLHDVRLHGRTIITCLFDSWEIIKKNAMQTALERFKVPIVLQGMNDAAAVNALIVSRLTPAYSAANFKPPFLSSPFSDIAIADAASTGMMPRAILMRCDAFRRLCLENGKVEVCNSLTTEVLPKQPASADNSFTSELDRLRSTADIAGMIASGDDSEFGGLLRAILDLYADQIDPDEAIDIENRVDPAQKIPPLHGRLTFTHHDENDREQHFCFRALEHSNAISFQSRLRAALTASGISSKITGRHLILVRRGAIPGGEKTKNLFAGFKNAGGVLINPSDDDLRMFMSLRAMRDESATSNQRQIFLAWLRAEKPLLRTDFFRQTGLSPVPIPASNITAHEGAEPRLAALVAPANGAAVTPKAVPGRPKADDVTKASPEPVRPEAIPIGRRMAVGEEPVDLPTKLLPRHTAIIAGSGSGKTVLLRRIVEEAALAGIPAIVIDPNNDLSRLGDPWSNRPEAFTAEDDTKARRYFGSVDVVVWTPGVHAGNPLFLPVMPDFASLGDDRDERQQAVEMAAETLGPLAGAKNPLQKGVLMEALRYFAERGGGDLKRFTALLTDLPDGLSPIGNAAKLAAGMADQLHAAVATNPLLKADGPILDPKLLFFGPDKKRVRISVINLSGLGSDAAREDFVNRLQMTLFGWIKKHPSPTGLLYVVDEAQTFLPAQRAALSLGSGIKLVAQARKYGLGMIVATQAPRGIYNQIVSNCTTQFFGKQNSPATIGAAQEIIAASGGAANDLGKLKTGEFYFSTEGSGKPGKVRTPICLSFHPANPPSPDEVVDRAKRARLALV